MLHLAVSTGIVFMVVALVEDMNNALEQSKNKKRGRQMM
jgi:hypothetical protein